jgi:hypothetical protein
MGYEREANEIRQLRQKFMVPSRAAQSPAGVQWAIRCLWRTFGWVAGYGYKPAYLLGWLAALWIGCLVFYWIAATHAGFAPSDQSIVQNAQYAISCSPPKGNWTRCKFPGYPTFWSAAYSADNLQPLVSFGQRERWTPIAWELRWGAIRIEFPASSTQWVAWIELVIGTVLLGLFGATASGLMIPK